MMMIMLIPLGFLFIFLIPIKILIWMFIFTVTLSVSWYFYLKQRTSYFLNKNIPSPPISSLYLGHLPEYEKEGKQHLKLVEWEKVYGDTFGIFEGSHRVIISSDIHLVNEVLVKQFTVFRSRKLQPTGALDQEGDGRQNLFLSEGNRWKRLRALISSCLTIKQIISIEPIIINVVDVMMGSIEDKRLQNGDIIDIKPILMNLTFSIIRKIAFGIDEEFNDNKMLAEMIETFQLPKATTSWNGYFFAGTYEFLKVTKYLNLFTSISTVGKILKMRKKMMRLLNDREKETVEERDKRPKDLIDFLKESCINENEIEDDIKNVLDIKVQKKLTKDELSSTCLMFIIAGTDTTANTLTFLLHDLALNKDIQEQVYEEITSCIEKEEDLTYHKIKELDLLERVIKESGRLHPLGPGIVARRAREDTIITKSNGETIMVDKGTCFAPNIYSIHMNEHLWGPNPEQFNPDRFLPENAATRPGINWLAFGYGPRICPGFKLAMHEVKLAIIQILKEYTVDLCPETKLDVTLKIVLSVNEMKLKFTPRI